MCARGDDARVLVSRASRDRERDHTVERRPLLPLIKARANRVRIVRHISRLHEPNRDTLVLYARFIGDTADYVLNQLIDATLGKDREFLAWRALQVGEPAVEGSAGDHPDPPAAAARISNESWPAMPVLAESRSVLSLALVCGAGGLGAARVAVARR